MNPRLNLTQRVVRNGLAAFAAVLLTTGAAWHVLAADGQTARTPMATVTTPIAHAIAGGRDSVLGHRQRRRSSSGDDSHGRAKPNQP